MSEALSPAEAWQLPPAYTPAQQRWRAENEARIRQIAQRIAGEPDDTLLTDFWEGHFVVVTKSDGRVRLWLIDGHVGRTQWAQSEWDLSHPLRPTFNYLRGMVLALLWQPAPRRLLFTGLGGGVLPTVMHHYLPAAHFDCVEIAPPVIRVARSFFPLPEDERMAVWTDDALAFLQKQTAPRYDILFLDLFVDQGSTPAHLKDRAFFAACRERLAPGGVLGLNLHGPPGDSRWALLADLFPTVARVPMKQNHSLALATDAPRLGRFHLLDRLRKIQSVYAFDFILAHRVEQLRYVEGAETEWSSHDGA